MSNILTDIGTKVGQELKADRTRLTSIEAATTPQALLTSIKTVDGSGSGLDADTVDGLEASAFATAEQGAKADAALPATTYTAADVLTKIKTVDGSGSGLDADLLDGIDSTGFVKTSTDQDIAGIKHFTGHVVCSSTGNTFDVGGVEIIGNGPANTVKPVLGFHQPSLFAGTLEQTDAYNFAFKRQDGALTGLNVSHVRNDAALGGNYNVSKLGVSRWVFGANSGDHTTNFNIYNYSRGSIDFTINESSGNVLIGTATDNLVDKLQVDGSISVSDLVGHSTSFYQSGTSDAFISDGVANTLKVGTWVWSRVGRTVTASINQLDLPSSLSGFTTANLLLTGLPYSLNGRAVGCFGVSPSGTYTGFNELILLGDNNNTYLFFIGSLANNQYIHLTKSNVLISSGALVYGASITYIANI